MPLYLITLFCALNYCGLVLADSEKPRPKSRAIEVFDDGIFEEKKADKESETVESAEGKRRYKGRNANYNNEQWEQWKNKCQISNEKGSPGFRDCVKKEKMRTEQGISANRDAVQKRMGASKETPAVESLKESFKTDSVLDYQ